MGARETRQASQYVKKLLLLTYILMNTLNVVIFFGAEWLAGIYNLSEGATATAVDILQSFALMAAVFWPPSFTVPNGLRAAGDAKYTMMVSIISMFVFRVALSYVLAYTTDLGVMSVWIGMYSDWIFRGIFFTLRFIQGKWKNIKLV